MDRAKKAQLIPVYQWLRIHMLLEHGKCGPLFPPVAECPACQQLGQA